MSCAKPFDIETKTNVYSILRKKWLQYDKIGNCVNLKHIIEMVIKFCFNEAKIGLFRLILKAVGTSNFS